ncbi:MULTISPECIES: OB-fold domain-containing protein [Nocardia]|uniref:OB-fold domain-containing protein n=1 Tax=Nocardia TaxID=1817 RepID=UPI000D695206|nr:MULTISPECIES: OB-fold domain-containing protein [Nocardia]
MSFVSSLGTYLPPWGTAHGRVPGADEDTVTLAVEAGRCARTGNPPVERVVLVTNDIPLLEGGIAAVLLAGLDLDPEIEVVQRLGGAPAALDAVATAPPRTLVIGVDLAPVGAAAAVIGESGVGTRTIARLARSLPVRTRDAMGTVYDYGDPRLLRERGVLESLRVAMATDKPRVLAGADHKLATTLCTGPVPTLPTTGASAALFALAWMVENAVVGPLVGVEQATVTGLSIEAGQVPVHRGEPAPRPLPRTQQAPGSDIPISLAAYDRAFPAKLRWQASHDPASGQLDFPPRLRVDDRGGLTEPDALVALPRTGTIYTAVTVRVPVPGVPTPYSLAIVELDDVGVRALVKVTGVEPGAVAIGDRGRLVLRRVAIRSGVTDYGYAFQPDIVNDTEENVA